MVLLATSKDYGALGYFKSLLNCMDAKRIQRKMSMAHLISSSLLSMGRYLLAAACQSLGIVKLDTPLKLPPGIGQYSSANQFEFLKTNASKVVEEFTLVDNAVLCEQVAESGDGVHYYAWALCHYGALLMDFLDSWSEGDGERTYRC